MIEPTDEMVQAYEKAWSAIEAAEAVMMCAEHDMGDCPYHEVPGARCRAGLAAFLAVVERDYTLTPICNNELMPGVVCKRSAINPRHTHEATLPNGSRAEWT